MAAILKLDQLQSDTGTVTVASNLAFSGASTFVGNIANPTITGTINLTGGGIKFPATQIASADGNTFDDYEEGTWTPDLKFGGGSTGITYSWRYGTYTKIGRLVIFRAGIALSSKGSSTGAAVFHGLPYASATINYDFNYFWAGGYDGTGVGGGNASTWVNHDGTTVVYVTKNTTNMPDATDADFSGTQRFVFNGYYVTS